MSLAKSVSAYLIGHWHISRKITAIHRALNTEEVKDGFFEVDADRSEKMPTPVFDWIVNHFSRAGDFIIDLLSEKGVAAVSGIKNSRNAIYFGNQEDQDKVRSRLASEVQPLRTPSVDM